MSFIKIMHICRRGFSASAKKMTIRNVTVIGGGLMGSGIAQVAAQAGFPTTVVDVNDHAVNNTRIIIQTSLSKIVKKKFTEDEQGREKFIADVMGQLTATTDLSMALSEPDIVVEAIVENLDSKQKLFSMIDKVAPKHTIFASNTSSLPILEIADTTERKDRFGGLHFFNPVPVMKLVEVVRTAETSEDTLKTLVEFGKALGKTTVVCRDTPGFIVNRLLIPFLQDAMTMLERGDATKEDIDLAVKLGLGHIIGPIELADYIGLDTAFFILEGWHKRFPENPLFKPSDSLHGLVEAGRYGRKTGEGFYKYK